MSSPAQEKQNLPQLMYGSHAMGLGAVKAGCRYFAGYPITPQTELLEYVSQEIPKNGGVFQQLNDEISSFMACFGAAASGVRCMTASVGPGLTLMVDGLANAAGAELPMVIGVLTRAHVGVSSGLFPAQSDIRMLKGGGNGDYHIPILAPNSCQETAELTLQAFDLAEKYRTPVFVAIDGFIAGMMETVKAPKGPSIQKKSFDWALNHKKGPPVLVSSYSTPEADTETVYRLHKKYQLLEKREVRFETFKTRDAEWIIVAFGIMARVAKTVVQNLREKGLKVGLWRPITLYPFPETALRAVSKRVKGILVTEINLGQILVDVKLAVNGNCPVEFLGQPAQPIPPQKLSEFLVQKMKKNIRNRRKR